MVKAFFSQLLASRAMNSKMADNAIRGFIDTHSPEEVIENLSVLNRWLPTVGDHASIMLKYALAFKSKALQPIYLKSIVKELREANNADLDSYLFGPLSMAYQQSGRNLLVPEARQAVVDYLAFVRLKYGPKGIQAGINEPAQHITAPYYHSLVKSMGLQQ